MAGMEKEKIGDESARIEIMLQSLAEKLMTRPLPSHQYWSLASIATHLDVSIDTARGYATQPGFPCRYSPPSTGHKYRGHPRWKSKEVLEWFERFRERN